MERINYKKVYKNGLNPYKFIYKHSHRAYKLLLSLRSARKEDSIRVLHSKLLRLADRVENPYKLLREVEVIMAEKEHKTENENL